MVKRVYWELLIAGVVAIAGVIAVWRERRKFDTYLKRRHK
jgi:hypothetical protein